MNTIKKKKLTDDEKIQSIKKQLMELYPNKVVTAISIHNHLYLAISKLAKLNNVSVSEFIEHLGFNSRIQIKTIKSIEECLLEVYPKRVVSKLKELDSNLYDRVRSHAKQSRKTVEQYLKELGFIYKKVDGKYKNLDIKATLRNIYPNSIVTNIYKEFPAVYQKLYRMAKRSNQTIELLLNEMGFEYNWKEREFRSIKECLSELYPSGVIVNLIEIDNKLYKRINKECVKKQTTMEDYIEELGFNYVKYYKGVK
jgi:endonuclease III